jgi:hypothetical protein
MTVQDCSVTDSKFKKKNQPWQVHVTVATPAASLLMKNCWLGGTLKTQKKKPTK